MALFNLLAVNAQSLNSFQKGIDLTNKNINNVYNSDYARERAIFEELPGYGVDMAEAHRVFDQRYFDRYLKENQTYTFHQEMSSNLGSLEAAFNDINGTGLSEDINAFYSKMNQLVKEPENMAARQDFLVTARKLVANIKNIYSSLENEQVNLHIAMDKEVQEINRLTESLAKVNEALKAQPTNLTIEQEKKNSLLNERDRLLKDLSGHIDMKVRYHPDGSVDLFSVKGHPLVLGDRNFDIAIKKSQKDLGGGLEITTTDIYIDEVKLSDEFSKGTFAAKFIYQKELENVMSKLNNFIIAFKEENNSIHQTGYGLDNSTGLDLFTGNHIKDIEVNQTLIDNPEKIATSSEEDTPANNEIALELYNLKENKIASLDNKTFYDYYIDIVGDIANSKDFHAKMAEDSRMLVDAIESKLQEISGVNMDEELINLMQLQHAYEAAAKVITVTDELLQTIIGLVR